MAGLSLRAVDAVLILSNDSSSPRLLAKYYSAPHPIIQPTQQPAISTKQSQPTSGSSRPAPAPSTGGSGQIPGQANHPYTTVKDQVAFERGLVEKTQQQQQRAADIILFDNRIVVFRSIANVTIYVVGPAYENELLLLSVAVCVRDVLTSLFVTANDQQTLDKQTILENYDVVALAIDEIIDDGIVLDTDRDSVLSRISPKPQADMPTLTDIDLSEQSLINVWKFARRALKDSGF